MCSFPPLATSQQRDPNQSRRIPLPLAHDTNFLSPPESSKSTHMQIKTHFPHGPANKMSSSNYMADSLASSNLVR